MKLIFVQAWFRELPSGVLDSLSPEQVMQSQSEEDCARLVTLLPAMEAALFNWAINLMADVAQFDHLNKMNARNVAVVFAPNMTKVSGMCLEYDGELACWCTGAFKFGVNGINFTT